MLADGVLGRHAGDSCHHARDGGDLPGPGGMEWVGLDQVARHPGFPAGYEMEQLARRDVRELIDALQQWYPEICAGAASCYTLEAFYSHHVFLAGEPDRDRDIAVLVTRKRGQLVAMWSCERNRRTRSLYGRLGAIAPQHRGARLTRAVMCLGEELGRAMGAELLYGLATLKHPYMQRTLEGLGWQFAGIAPYDREEVMPGVVKRVYEALYVKVLAGAADVLRPELDNLTPRVRDGFRRLYSPLGDDENRAVPEPGSAPAARSSRS